MESILLFCALVLCGAWIGYRAERQQDETNAKHHEARRQLEAGACLSALHASTRQLQDAAKDLTGAVKRKPDPLPGMQVKPKRQDGEHMKLIALPVKGSFAPKPKKRAKPAR